MGSLDLPRCYTGSMVTKQRMSAEEYLALPDVKPYLEYSAGEVLQKVSPKRKHWRLASELVAILNEYSKTAGGESGPEPRVKIVSDGEIYYVLPDVGYWAPDQPVGDDETTLPPTLAIEIRSPEQSMHQQREKCRFYRRAGVKVCWLIDPEARTLERFEADIDGLVERSGGETLQFAALPRLQIDLGALFSVLDG